MSTKVYDFFDNITEESIVKNCFNDGSLLLSENEVFDIASIDAINDLVRFSRTRLELERVISNGTELPFDEISEEVLEEKTKYNKKLIALLIDMFDFCKVYIKKNYSLNPFSMMFYQEANNCDFQSFRNIFSGFFITNEQKNFANNFVVKIREKLQDKDYKKKVQDLKQSNKKNFISGLNFINSLFDKHSRLMVIRIDLAYKSKDEDKDNQNGFIDCNAINLKRVRDDRKKFFNNIRMCSISESMLGYIWKLEYGQDKGLHYHMIFFFDGSKVCKDAHYADEIGKYWNKITGDLGCYYNCNRSKSQYKKLGIGTINYYDTNLRDNLTWKVLAYLVKKDQMIKPDISSKVKSYRSFGRSEIPEPKSRAGKPRKKDITTPAFQNLHIVNSDSNPTGTLQVQLGIFKDQTRAALWLPSKESNSVFMILGASDSGKTDILKGIASELMKKEFPVLIIDFNGYIDFPGLDKALISPDSDSRVGFRRLINSFYDSEDVEKILSSNNRINLSKVDDFSIHLVAVNLLRMIFNTLRRKGPIPVNPVDDSERYRLFIVIDEAKILYKRGRNRKDSIFNTLVKEGQKFGIGLIFASQMSESFSDEIKTNISARLVLKPINLDEAEKNAAMVYVTPKEINNLEGKGDGYYRCNANQGTVLISIKN